MEKIEPGNTVAVGTVAGILESTDSLGNLAEGDLEFKENSSGSFAGDRLREERLIVSATDAA
ncbi:hypothetical protein QUA81_32410 [Microcoleus sp. F6_B4]